MKRQGTRTDGILVKLKAFYQKLAFLDDSPEKIAKGFALGTFIGMTPFVGFQALISVFIARLLKWNRMAAGLAAFQTNVFTGAFVFAVNYSIGATLLGVGELEFQANSSGWFDLKTMFGSGSSVLYAFLLGGFVTGLPSAIIAYWCVLLFVRRRQFRLRITKTESHENKSKTVCLDNRCESGTWEGAGSRTCKAAL